MVSDRDLHGSGEAGLPTDPVERLAFALGQSVVATDIILKRLADAGFHVSWISRGRLMWSMPMPPLGIPEWPPRRGPASANGV